MSINLVLLVLRIRTAQPGKPSFFDCVLIVTIEALSLGMFRRTWIRYQNYINRSVRSNGWDCTGKHDWRSRLADLYNDNNERVSTLEEIARPVRLPNFYRTTRAFH